MAVDYFQSGQIKTVVTVNLTGQRLNTSGGSWDVRPSAVVWSNASYVQAFKTVNVGSSICGPEGMVQYEAADGSVFTMEFDCPVSSKNVCNGTVSGGSPYKIESDVPRTGADIEYKWNISQKSYLDFVDAPIFSVDLIRSEKCDLVPTERVLKFIDNRTCLYLKDVFAIDELPAQAKIWCAVHDLFLTPQSKAILLRDLAQKAAGEFTSNFRNFSGVFDDALSYNLKVSAGTLSDIERERLRGALNACDTAADGVHRDTELLTVKEALLNHNLSEGWKTAVNAYISVERKEGAKERRDAVITLIKERL
jgi:hypothetical protein